MEIIYRVNIVKRTESCDVFISGVDDFTPVDCKSEQEAETVIDKLFGDYYIQKIYKSKGDRIEVDTPLGKMWFSAEEHERFRNFENRQR